MKKLALLAALMPALALAAPAAKGKTEVTWYGHAAFVVKTPGGTVLAIDPWISNPTDPDKQALDKLSKVDFILVSHGHFDHVGDAIALQKKTNAKFVGAFELGHALVGAGAPADSATMATLGNPGGTIKLNDEVSVTIVPAIHSSGFQKGDNAPMEYAGNPVGFIIHVKGGPTIYHSGDTDVFGEMKSFAERWHPDVAMLCIGGHFTMDPVGAAQAQKMIGAKIVIPMHYGTFPILDGTPEELEKAMKAEHAKGKVLVMKPGETKEL